MANPFNGIESEVDAKPGPANCFRIHSMELKGHEEEGARRPKEPHENPFNGIESMSVGFGHQPTRLENPFNGIERAGLGEGPPAGESHRNPFNGIESMNSESCLRTWLPASESIQWN